MDTEPVFAAGSVFSWEALLAVLLIAAAYLACRGINAMKRPVCNGGCAGCHGARQGRGCAFPEGRGRRMLR